MVYFLFFFALALFALYYCFREVKFGDLVGVLKQANYFYVGISVITGILVIFVRALRWNILIDTLDAKPSLRDTYNAIMVGYIANLAVPRLGEIIRCATLNRTNRIPVNALFGTVVTERIIDLLCLMLLAAAVFFLKMDLFSRFVAENVLQQWKPIEENMSATTVAVAALAVLALIAALYFLGKRMWKKPFAQKIKKSLAGLFDGLISIFKMKNRIRFIVYTVIIWICYLLGCVLILESLPSTAGLTVADGLFLLVLGTMGWVVPTPGGFGTFHWIVATGLTMYGIPFEEGLGIATLSHESQLPAMILLGFIALISVSITKFKPIQK
jgi:uncharacterized protein (TIRG00374 family)